jgi:hypothetical protein
MNMVFRQFEDRDMRPGERFIRGYRCTPYESVQESIQHYKEDWWVPKERIFLPCGICDPLKKGTDISQVTLAV